MARDKKKGAVTYKMPGYGGRQDVQNLLGTIFLLYMAAVYPVIIHDKYFDITMTKYKAFVAGAGVYIVLMVFAVLADTLSGLHNTFDEKKDSLWKRYDISIPDIFMGLFTLANVIAFFIAEDKSAAYSGADGRNCGLHFVLLAAVLYVCMGRRYSPAGWELTVFMAVSALTEVVAVLQYAGIDFLGLREGLSDSISDIYISTFGNIDIYGSFLCVAVPVAMGVYVCDKRPAARIVAGVSLVTGAAAMIITNADLTYAGTGAALILAVMVSFYRGWVKELAGAMLWLSLGFVLMSTFLSVSGTGFDGLTGVGKFSSHTAGIFGVFIAVLALWLVCTFVIPERIEAVRGKRALAAAVSVSVLAVLAAFAAFRATGYMDAYLTFGDSWGNYRGYVWTRLMEIYRDFPPYKWLFGNGNESVLALMKGYCYDEMVSVTGHVYDNAHNEYLQYLVTTGLLGAVSYTGLVAGSVGRSLGRCRVSGSEDDGRVTMCFALALGMTGYAVQAVFNLNQSLTTPYMFIMLALSAGVCRRQGRA